MFIIKEGTPADKIGEGTPPEVLESITKHLEKTGHVVRTTEQEKTFLQTKTQEEINKVIGERNAQFEATILETTGIPKTQGEKFHEYHKRAVVEKTKLVGELEAKIKEFEKNGLSGSQLAQQYKTELETLQGKMSSLNSEWEKKLIEKDGEVFQTKVQTEIEKVVAKVRASIDPTIKPVLVDDILAARLAKFSQENKAFNLEGMIIFKGNDGVTRTSKKDGKPESLEEVFAPYVADIIATKREQGGAGSSGGQAGGQGQAAKWKDTTLPETVKTQVQLTEFLMKELKLDPSKKDYSEAFEALKGNLPLK